jgi:hypothetical protein
MSKILCYPAVKKLTYLSRHLAQWEWLDEELRLEMLGMRMLLATIDEI